MTDFPNISFPAIHFETLNQISVSASVPEADADCSTRISSNLATPTIPLAVQSAPATTSSMTPAPVVVVLIIRLCLFTKKVHISHDIDRVEILSDSSNIAMLKQVVEFCLPCDRVSSSCFDFFFHTQ